jgi:putative ABC transport system permease protein
MSRHHPLVIAAASRVYGAALRLCPRWFARRYGADMRATFEALCVDARASGKAAVISLLIRELADVAAAAGRACAVPHAHDRQGGRDRRHQDHGHHGQAGTAHSHEGRAPVGAIWQDMRYAVRMLRRQPGFTLVAVLTLALGIGANTAVFTVVNGVLLRPLSYGDSSRLVILMFGRPGLVSPWFSPLNYLDFTSQSEAFTESAAFAPTTVNITGQGDPERIDGARVSWNFFHALQVPMPVGRAFMAGDATGSGAAVVVISDGLWKRRYGARADAVGSVLDVDGTPMTIVGVAGPEVKLPRSAQFWQPLVFAPRDIAPPARGAQWISAVARLRPGVDLNEANAALATVSSRLAADYPRINQGHVALARPLQQQMVRAVRPALLVLLGAVSFVLLIACVNVANLLLARSQGRSREVAVRAALGAGRRRLVQQFLSESLVLGGLGAVAGLMVAFWCTRALVWLGPRSIPRLSDVRIDVRVLAFTAAITLATSVLFGLAPALASTGGAVARFIRGAGRGAAGGPGGTRMRKALVVCELALAAVLLVGAGLLIRSYQRLQQVNPGFDPEHIVTFNVSLPEKKYGSVSDIGAFVTTLVNRLASRPGVDSAAGVFGLPFAGEFSAYTSFTRRGEVDTADAPSAGMRIVTPDYFRTMRIPLRAGRVFDAHDDDAGPEVAMINERAALRFWPGQNPIGQQIHVSVRLTRGVRSDQKTIVGIVGDVKYGALDEAAPAEIYLPFAQHQVDSFTIAIRTAGDPMSFTPVLRSEVASLDRELPVADVQSMSALIGSSIAERRFTMLLLVTFAVVAAMLAAIGIYGVLAYLVSQRTQEIGVRLAIGASPGDVVGLFVREGAVLVLVGLAGGVAGALAASRALTTLLFGVAPTDPATFAGVAAVLTIVALLATYVPARRAAAVNPMKALGAD